MPENRPCRLNNSKPTPCLWAQAGVVRKKQCSNNYFCAECHFDRVMKRTARENRELRQAGKRQAGKKAEIISWKDKLNSMPISKRPCIHHMKGRIEFRSCTNEYSCGNCDFDQYFNDQFSVHAMMSPINLLSISGINVPQGYYFHKGHTWIKIEEDNSVRIGIDDFALRLMGPLSRIEAPLMGKKITHNEASILVKRGGHSAAMLAPVSGVVMAINPELREEGSLANNSPYSEGWVMKVEPDNLREEIKHLMINQETDEFIKGQVDMLYDLVEEVSGPLAADGGDLTSDIFGNLPEIGWDNLVHRFLGTK
ncbi:glycine cleavage system protein H [Thermodesulfobacteriota bacterium]